MPRLAQVPTAQSSTLSIGPIPWQNIRLATMTDVLPSDVRHRAFQEHRMPDLAELHVNGVVRRIDGDPERSLLSVLRDDLDLTGSKYGCGEGRCGACTVLVDGKAMRSCVTSAGDCEGKHITTIEGLEHDGKLHPLQEAFLEAGAMQCGYCTCGMIMSGVSLLARNADPTVPEIVRSMEGNICRCGTYLRIVQAIRQAATLLKRAAP
jgi:aerobic-type carbon monoxide dehydrogenase small subunit (CoxS/CutS family)